METIIIICLIIIIVLLLQDKVFIQRSKRTDTEPSPEQQPENNIMGQPKAVERTKEPKRTLQSHKKEGEPETPDTEHPVEEKETGTPFPEEVPTDIRDELPDPGQQWESFEYPEVSSDFSAGVTYDEISTVAKVLKQPELPGTALQGGTVKIVEKMKDTELFALLENSIEGASQKIAKLLDQNISNVTATSRISSKKNDLENFDMGEFI